jgi:hypothetical protein
MYSLGACLVVVSFTDNGGCGGGIVLGAAEDASGGGCTTLLFCIRGRFLRLLIELFVTPGMSIGGTFFGFGGM